MGPQRYEFNSSGCRCIGWFYQPDGDRPYACVVLGHGFGASPDGPLGELSLRLADAGIAAFSFDYRGFGESDGVPRQVLNAARQLEDWAAAIAYVRSRGDVKTDRVGIWGSSLSGGQALVVAAHDPAIAAAVVQVPYSDGLSVARAAGLRHHARTFPALARDLLRAATRRPPFVIAALGPPGEVAAVTTQASDLYREVLTRAPGWRNEIAARSLVSLYAFRPIRTAARIRCPLLVVSTYQDQIAPSDAAMRVAQKLPFVELALFRGQHFDLYAGPPHEQAMHTEVLFFRHYLSRAGTGRAQD